MATESHAKLYESQRTRLGKGLQPFLKSTDLRRVEARRYAELLAEILAEIGPSPTLWQARLAESLAHTTVSIEKLRLDMAQGNAVDLPTLTKLVNTQRRLMIDLAIEDRGDES